MITPQFLLPIASELVIDLFAGGGGASTGIELAIGRHVDIAINHDPEAVSLHEANHPQTRHFVSDVFEVDPLVVTDGQPVGMLWASPDCKHFSKAKGGKPVSKKIRSLATVVIEWVKALQPTNRHPRQIFLENVEEFKTWGPLLDDNMPDPARKGETFKQWVAELEAMGYVVEYRELRACDYGAPTIRKRLFLIARRDGMPIAWPEPTHAAPGSLAIKARKLKPWRTAADCIDWDIPAPSIFERKKPLAEATNRRIAKGIMRYVIEAKEPFIVPATYTKAQESQNVLKATAYRPDATDRDPPANASPIGGSMGAGQPATAGPVVGFIPTLISMGHGERHGQQPRVPGIETPHSTITAQGQHSALVTAFLAKHYTGVADPVATVTSVDHHSLVAANLIHMGHGEGKDGTKRFSHGIRDVEQPLNTITASGVPGGIVTSHMLKLRGDNVGSATDEPLHTISAQGTHHAEVRAFLIKYYGTDQDPALLEPLHTVTTKDRFGLVMVKGEPYAIVDIGLRMLAPRELYRAQGFPESYRIDTGADGRPLTKTAQVRMCGNSVCPPLAQAIVAANYQESAIQRKVA